MFGSWISAVATATRCCSRQKVDRDEPLDDQRGRQFNNPTIFVAQLVFPPVLAQQGVRER